MHLSERERKDLLAQVGESPVAIVILEEAKKIYDDKTQDVILHGRICDDDFRRDMRYMLGIAAGMKMLLDKVKEAKDAAKNQ